MKFEDDFEIIQNIIKNTVEQIIATDQLLQEAERRKMPLEFVDLVEYWRDGKLYASQVSHMAQGYMPTADCAWTTQYQRNFFGFNPALGSFEINSNTINPMNAVIEASLDLGNAAVCVTVHPARKEFAVGMRNGFITIYRVELGKILRTFRHHESRVGALAYSPTENVLVSGNENGELVKWDNSGNIISKTSASDWIRSIDFSPDGTKFLTSHRAKKESAPTIYHWDTESFKIIESFIHVSKTVSCVRYLLDGKRFVSGGSDYKITVWSFEKNDVLWSEEKHTGAIIVLAVHPFGGIVASGAWTGTVKLWDLETGLDVRSIDAHSGRVNGLAISPSGKILATGGKESSICLWQLPDCSILGRFVAHDGWLRGLQFIDESTLVSIGSEGLCKIWRFDRSIPSASLLQHYNSPKEVLNELRRSLDSDDE